MTVGFAGLGKMGAAIATNLLSGGAPLVVWNRTPEKCAPLVEAGALEAGSIDELCAQSQTIFVMLLDDAAIDGAFGRATPAFRRRLRGRTVVNLGTTSPAYSEVLERDLHAIDARYVEAPVSGSRGPAERGQLVGMVSAHDDAALERVLPLLATSCRRIVHCGPVPGALRMKLAVNHYLIAMVGALAEAVHVASASGVDLSLMRDILDAGPMASELSRQKLDKLVRGDFAAQAALDDVSTIAHLVVAEADAAGAEAPLIRTCALLYRRARNEGHGGLDMAGVIHAFESWPRQGRTTDAG